MAIVNWYLRYKGDFHAMEKDLVFELQTSPMTIGIPAFDSFIALPNDFGKVSLICDLV